jgi:type I restriction enzyme M protein
MFTQWKNKNIPGCKAIDGNTKPKKFGHGLSEGLLAAFSNLELIDKYDVYQHLMTYWMKTMQDDCYLIASNGWAVGNELEWGEKEFKGKLIPKQLLLNRYFAKEQKDNEQQEADCDTIAAGLEELTEEHCSEEGYFTDFAIVNKATVANRLKELQTEKRKLNKKNIYWLQNHKWCVEKLRCWNNTYR